MDLKQTQDEVHKLSEIIDGWQSLHNIDLLERDLALEKLRILYETLRFDVNQTLQAQTETPKAATSESNTDADITTAEQPLAIELSAALSLEPTPGPTPSNYASEAPLTTTQEEHEVSDSEAHPNGALSDSIEPFDEIVIVPSVAVTSDNNTSSEEPLTSARDLDDTELRRDAELPDSKEPFEEIAVEPQKSPINASSAKDSDSEDGIELISLSEPNPLPNPIIANDSTDEPAATSVATNHPSEAVSHQDVAASQSEDSDDSALNDRAKSDYTPSDSQPEKTETSEGEVFAPTLFEVDDQTQRHLYKQQFIRSLYDSEVPIRKAESAKSQKEVKSDISAADNSSAPSKNATSVVEPLKVDEPTSQTNEEASGHSQTDDNQDQQLRSASPEPEQSSNQSDKAVSQPTPAAEHPTSGTILADVINQDQKTLGDSITPPRDRASELRRGEPVAQLRQAIGINDKFLIIHDLFSGDNAAYERVIDKIDSFDNMDDCLIYIAENFAWNANTDGAKLLMDLLERKFN